MVLSREVTPNELLEDPTLLLHEKDLQHGSTCQLESFLANKSNRHIQPTGLLLMAEIHHGKFVFFWPHTTPSKRRVVDPRGNENYN
jgi:hypothetical protein